MSTADAEFKTVEFVERRLGRRRTIGRTTLGLLIAGVEGSTSFAVVMGTAFAYHIFVLGLPIGGVDWPLYFIFGTLAGLLYGAFSTVATNRFLDAGERPRSTLPDSFYGWTAALALTLLMAFLLGSIGDLSRISLTSAYLAGVPMMLALRSFGQALLAERISRGQLHYQRVAVLGKRLDVMNFLLNGDLWKQGQKITDTLYLEDIIGADGELARPAVADFARMSLKKQADSIIIVASFDDLTAIEGLIAEMKRFALNIVYAPATSNRTLKFLDVVPIGANNALRFIRKPLSDADVFAKRAMDIALSLIGLTILTPVFALVALLIRLDSPGPIIYRQARRGFNGETFMIWKFRSMRVTESGHAMQQAERGDSRITRIGRFIRATSIDELPQLVNVLAGHMSIVGPRPHAIVHDDQLGKVLATYAHRQRIKPGITGWAQVNGFRGETKTFEAVQGRTLHDLHYIDNWSIILDFWIIVLTVFSVRAHKNVF